MQLTDRQLRDLHDHAYIRNNLEVRTVPAQCLDQYQGETITLPNLDFHLGFAVRIDEESAVTVNEGYLEAVNLKMSDIWQYWLTSTPRNISIKKMADIIASMCPEEMLPPESLNEDLLVVYYDSHAAGSACVLHPQIQKKLLKIYPEGFNIILSSIYEAIVTPADFSPMALTEIMHEANANNDIIKKDEVATQFVYACHKPCEIERMVC